MTKISKVNIAPHTKCTLEMLCFIPEFLILISKKKKCQSWISGVIKHCLLGCHFKNSYGAKHKMQETKMHTVRYRFLILSYKERMDPLRSSRINIIIK